MPELVACSNRGPYVYERVGDHLAGRRGGGGLIGAVTPIMEHFGGTWVTAPMSVGDRELARSEPEGREENGFVQRFLEVPPELYDLYYGTVSNEHLWFLFHYLFDVPSRPLFDATFAEAWDAYLEINRLFADGVAAASERPDAILVHDYHLMRVGAELRERGVDGPLVYFHHTPWCEPDYFTLLPDRLRASILEGVLAHDVAGFHAHRWARSFIACCDRFVEGAKVSDDEVVWDGRTTRVLVAPVPLDVPRLEREAALPQTERWMAWIEGVRAGRRLIARVDRIDLSKNPLRGFLAFEELLERRPELAEDTLFLALQYPSRTGVRKYREYFLSCLRAVQRVNERFGSRAPGDDGPLGLYFRDEFHRSLAGLRSYDTLLVNPVYDGLNMVMKEGAVTNERDGVVILSQNAGAHEEMGDDALSINPFDVTGTADAMERALEMDDDERSRRAASLRDAARASTPQDWMRTQLDAAGISI